MLTKILFTLYLKLKNKKSIAIIGGGPASMMLACSLDTTKYSVTIYEKNNALGRKFLVAGKGGFNLTHSENMLQFAERYTPTSFVKPFLEKFTNTNLRHWLKELGIETYIGTSKRVFPIKGIKPVEVLKAIEKKILQNQVSIQYNHEWKDWKNNELTFEINNHQTLNIKADIVVFALGGGSWSVTGSNSLWLDFFHEKGILTKPFYPSNCAYKIDWNSSLLKLIEGQVLKNCAFRCGNITRKGEAVLTKFGIEGSGVYPLSPEIRRQLLSKQKAELLIDFKPDLSKEEIELRLDNKGKLSIKEFLEKKIHLTNPQIELIKHFSSKEEYNNKQALRDLIKNFALTIVDASPLDDAISTVGGIDLNELNEDLELKKMPNHYCLGEMLDWDAPTGGYLLQACFSMGYSLAKHLNNNLSGYEAST